MSKGCCSNRGPNSEALKSDSTNTMAISSTGCCGDSPKASSVHLTQSSCGSAKPAAASCCDSDKPDYLLWVGVSFVGIAYVSYITQLTLNIEVLQHLGHSVYELMNTMFVGLLVGIFMVALLGRLPREFVVGMLGKPGGRCFVGFV